MAVPPYGIVLGRFQPFHIGHLEYVAAAKERCKRLVIGITNPYLAGLHRPGSDPNRLRRENNPFSYFTRHIIIDAALRGEGWPADSFAIVAVDIDDPEIFVSFLPTPDQSRVFITIYDDWGEEKLRRITTEKFLVEILWRRTMAERETSGTEIRDLIRNGQRWEHLVPTGAVQPIADQLIADVARPTVWKKGKTHAT